MTENSGRRPPALPIRVGMDVYSVDQEKYIGSVVAVSGARSISRGTGARDSAQHATDVSLVHEEGHQTEGVANVGSRPSGEEMGPFPTVAAGNTGPVNQSSDQQYATTPAGVQGVEWFGVRPGRINPIATVLVIPTSAVRSLSMDRIVVDLEGLKPR